MTTRRLRITIAALVVFAFSAGRATAYPDFDKMPANYDHTLEHSHGDDSMVIMPIVALVGVPVTVALAAAATVPTLLFAPSEVFEPWKMPARCIRYAFRLEHR